MHRKSFVHAVIVFGGGVAIGLSPGVAHAQHERTAESSPPSEAVATPSVNAPTPTEPTPLARAASAEAQGRVHRGLSVRAALGAGFARDGLSYEGPFRTLVPTGEATGASIAGDLAITGSLKPGLFLGGTFFFEQVTNPKVTFDGATVTTDVSVGTLLFIGPCMDWYFDPQKGMHLVGAVGGSRITTKDKSGQVADAAPVGGGVMAGFGWDWWIGERWSAGLLGRVVITSMRDGDVRHTWTSFSVMATLTYD
jgi:hypothetical protein